MPGREPSRDCLPGELCRRNERFHRLTDPVASRLVYRTRWVQTHSASPGERMGLSRDTAGIAKVSLEGYGDEDNHSQEVSSSARLPAGSVPAVSGRAPPGADRESG